MANYQIGYGTSITQSVYNSSHSEVCIVLLIFHPIISPPLSSPTFSLYFSSLLSLSMLCSFFKYSHLFLSIFSLQFCLYAFSSYCVCLILYFHSRCSFYFFTNSLISLSNSISLSKVLSVFFLSIF